MSKYLTLIKFFISAHFFFNNNILNLFNKVIVITDDNVNINKKIIKKLIKHSSTNIYLLTCNDKIMIIIISLIRKEVSKMSITYIHCNLISFTFIAYIIKVLVFCILCLDILINYIAVITVDSDLTTKEYKL